MLFPIVERSDELTPSFSSILVLFWLGGRVL